MFEYGGQRELNAGPGEAFEVAELGWRARTSGYTRTRAPFEVGWAFRPRNCMKKSAFIAEGFSRMSHTLFPGGRFVIEPRPGLRQFRGLS